MQSYFSFSLRILKINGSLSSQNDTLSSDEVPGEEVDYDYDDDFEDYDDDDFEEDTESSTPTDEILAIAGNYRSARLLR